MTAPSARIALLPWGNVIEDFLDTIGLSFEDFRDEMTGGWLFGYVQALRLAGVETAIFCVSSRIRRLERHRHRETGVPILVLPAARAYLALRRRLRDPYGWSREDALGDVRGRRLAAGLAAREAAPYLATPLRLLAREIRRLGCSALLCQEYESPRFDASVLLGRLVGLPVFATFQGGDLQLTALERRLRPVAVRAAAGLVIGPALEAERVQRRYGVPSRKVGSIPNPLDVSAWTPGAREQARAELGLPSGARVVAWHGRVEIHRKGLDVLVDAWRGLAALRPHDNLRLLLVGTGTDASALRRLVEPVRSVTWIDEYLLDRGRIRRLLSAADVYVFPSRVEGLPVAPLEAMALGLPIVAADLPGTRQILGGVEAAGGVIVPQEDPDALAAELARLLADETLRAKLGRRARERVETSFSPEAVGHRLRDFFVRNGMRVPPLYSTAPV